MLFPRNLCLVRGGGDLATGVIYRLRRAGLPVGVLELDQPRVARRRAAYAEALYSGAIAVAGLTARRVPLEDLGGLVAPGAAEFVPVVVDPAGEAVARLRPDVLVDARMAKAALDTRLEQAPLVVGLGPGFEAGVDCHAVVETNRGHDLGRVLWQGSAQPDTGRPEAVLGLEKERVLRAPVNGRLQAQKAIGDFVLPGELIAVVDGQPILAPFGGVLRGLVHDGLGVTANEKVGDLDPRGRREACFTISDKSLAVGGGVVEAVLTWLETQNAKAGS